MAFNAQLYNEINRPQTNDANELIETILKENPNK
jgi:wyosine [tRNA(Phe)-imidazoG37] synthetase (radical SAM superfamily)